MSSPAIVIRLDHNGRPYSPGERLSGEYRIESLEPGLIEAVEVSVLWYTEGKGDEDLAVHEFWRKQATAGDMSDLERPERFSTTLPLSPLSYEGLIIKIRWCVRVRAIMKRGRDLVDQKVFRLGEVPPVKPLKDSPAVAATPPTDVEQKPEGH